MTKPSNQANPIAGHYDDASYYDHFYARRKHDVAFYADLCEELGGPILELGVGTGRVAMALASRGLNVVGVDRMESMLEGARGNLSKKPRRIRDRIQLKCGDMRTLRLRKKFSVVISPFNVFMHLYERTDVERALATVRNHLAPSGRLIFDVMLPDPFDLARPDDRVYQCGKVTDPQTKKKYTYTEQFRYDPLMQIHQVTMRMDPVDAEAPMRTQSLRQRQFFPAELEALLHYNRFTIETVYGDFKRRPLLSDDESMIFVCHATKRKGS